MHDRVVQTFIIVSGDALQEVVQLLQYLGKINGQKDQVLLRL